MRSGAESISVPSRSNTAVRSRRDLDMRHRAPAGSRYILEQANVAFKAPPVTTIPTSDVDGLRSGNACYQPDLSIVLPRSTYSAHRQRRRGSPDRDQGALHERA